MQKKEREKARILPQIGKSHGAACRKIVFTIKRAFGCRSLLNWRRDTIGSPHLPSRGGTAGLIVADPHVMPYFRSHSENLDDVNDTFDAQITSAEVTVLPVSLMLQAMSGMTHTRWARHCLLERLTPTARS